MPAKLENSAVATGLEKFPIPKKGNDKECLKYHIIVLISHAREVMLKILQEMLQAHVKTENFQMYKLGFRESEEPEIKLTTFVGS